jgi:hypothetical protein
LTNGCGRRIFGRSGVIFRGKAAAVMSSMAAGGQACQRTGGNALDELAGFRAGWYRCLWQRPDALFETTDAVLTAGPVPSLPYLSLEPVMRRGHGMVYQGLAEGKIDEDACGTCWWPAGRGPGRQCSRSTPPPIRGRRRRPARSGSSIITAARARTARTGW